MRARARHEHGRAVVPHGREGVTNDSGVGRLNVVDATPPTITYRVSLERVGREPRQDLIRVAILCQQLNEARDCAAYRQARLLDVLL